MEGLGLKEGNDVQVELSTPPDGCYIKLQPHKTEFIELPDPKASIIKIIDVNVNVDFDPPLDYVPPPIVEKYDEERFPGKGHKLGSA